MLTKKDSLIRQEIVDLCESGKISEVFDELPMNSYERNYCLQYIDNKTFIDYCIMCNKNVQVNCSYPSTYNEAVLVLLFPQLIERFQKK